MQFLVYIYVYILTNILHKSLTCDRSVYEMDVTKMCRNFQNLKKEGKRSQPRPKAPPSIKGKKASTKGSRPTKDKQVQVVTKQISDQIKKLRATLQKFDMDDLL